MSNDATPECGARVLLLAPTRRDGEVSSELLQRVGIDCLVCGSLGMLAEEMARGVGVVMLTDQALRGEGVAELLRVLALQPPWSDVPTVLLSSSRAQSPAFGRTVALLRNVTMLDRPCSTPVLVSAVQSALRARQRQYQLAAQMDEQHKAEEALKDADRRKDEFLATLAHELRNPLAPIGTGLNLLSRLSPGDAEQAGRVRAMMERQLALLVKLIDDLLDISRIATGKVVLQRVRADLRGVIQVALEGSQPMIEAARHHLQLDLPDEPVWVLGDPSRLAQVLSNLLNNAAKYTPAGGQLRLSLRVEDGEAVIAVADNGVGIPPHMLQRVFEIFTQVNRTLDRAQGGLGIGLSLVQRLMGLHGGTVSAASAGADCGSTFTVRLPRLVSGGAFDDGQPPRENVHPHRRLKILVVDDNQDAADSLAMLLQANGHRTRTEYNGEAALRAAGEFQPDAVLCDLGLPGIDGNEVAQRLRADRRYAATLLIALTGWGSEEDKRRTRKAGFDRHLVKPVSAELLGEVLPLLQDSR